MDKSTITLEGVNKSLILSNTSITSFSRLSLGEIEHKMQRLSINSFKKKESLRKKRKTKKKEEFSNNNMFTNDLAPILIEIENDFNYSMYQVKKKKADEINKLNFISKQPSLNIMNKNQLKKQRKINGFDIKNKISKENWIKMQREVNKNKDSNKEVYYETELSSSDSYDSDLNPLCNLTKIEIEKRMNEIKKTKKTKEMSIINDMQNIFEIYDIISH